MNAPGTRPKIPHLRPRILTVCSLASLLFACGDNGGQTDSVSDSATGATEATATAPTSTDPTGATQATSTTQSDATTEPTGGDATSSGSTGEPEVPGDPEIVYFNYLPADDGPVLANIQLSVERRDDGKIYLSDAVMAGKVSYYALNGSVHRIDARQLSQQALPANRWLHLVKFVADIDNVNSEGWKTSHQYTGGQDTRDAASFETSFYIADGTSPPDVGHTEPLWTADTVTDALTFKATPAFSLPPGKQYGSESVPLDESQADLGKVSWNLADDRYRLLYAGDVAALMSHLGLQSPNGITSLGDAELQKAADWLANRTPSKLFAVDFEPANPAEEAWMWDYDSPNFDATMRTLSEKIYTGHAKYFYSWIGSQQSFSHHGVKIALNGYTTGNWEGANNSLDDALKVHEDPAGISQVEKSSSRLTQVGFGYTSIVINGGDPNDPATAWKSPTAWYLRALDVLNIEALIAKDELFLLFLWPYEDQPNDAKRSLMTRFTLPGYAGMMRQTDNRVIYPPNLIRDAIVTYLCNPRVVYTNYWLFGESADPSHALKYARINGVQSCEVANTPDFHVYEYEGPDSPPCPAGPGTYISKDVLGVGAMVQGHEIFARHLADTLDGTQVREPLDQPFTYTRSDGALHMAEWKPDTGEFVRAFKHQQPWVQVWKNPMSGARVLLFQDSFAEAFEPVDFSVQVGGVTVDRVADGNNLYYEVL